jgi:hypothetical protein
MVICKLNWGKWYVNVKKYMSENAVTLFLCLNEDGSGLNLVRKCTLEEMYRMFPEPLLDSDEIRFKDFLYSLGIREKPLVEKWINYVVPLLIEEGIKKGYWDK